MSPFLFQGAPKPIAIEPCSGNKAAVLTVFLCLPRGSSGVPPPGQSGKACAGEHYICPSAMQSVWTIARVQNNAQHMKARSCSVKRCLVWAQCLMTNFHLEFDVVSHIKSPVGKRGWCAYILLQEASKRAIAHQLFCRTEHFHVWPLLQSEFMCCKWFCKGNASEYSHLSSHLVH